jgi:hypothetical protein
LCQDEKRQNEEDAAEEKDVPLGVDQKVDNGSNSFVVIN